MTSRPSSRRKLLPPEAPIELQLDETLLDIAFSDKGQGDPERILIELEEAGDLTIIITELDNGDKQIQFFIED